ncbi:PilW family protein [Candidatus Latescibacterota bacterium]
MKTHLTHIKRLSGNERGMTLMELLVAAVLGMIILTGAFQFFITQTKNFNLQRQSAEMQQELRHAMNFLNEHVKLAGNGVPPTSGWQVLENYDGGSGPDSLCVLGSFKSLVITTDINMQSAGASVKVVSNVGVEEGDLIVISYPPNGWQDIFYVTMVNPGENQILHQKHPPWNMSIKLNNAYPSGSLITVVTHYSFFVETENDGRMNLMVQTQANPPMILAGDIDDFQIRFQLKNSAWVDEPSELMDIRMVEITLRLKSPNPIQGYTDPVYGDAHNRVELKSIVIPKNIVIVSNI